MKINKKIYWLIVPALSPVLAIPLINTSCSAPKKHLVITNSIAQNIKENIISLIEESENIKQINSILNTKKDFIVKSIGQNIISNFNINNIMFKKDENSDQQKIVINFIGIILKAPISEKIKPEFNVTKFALIINGKFWNGPIVNVNSNILNEIKEFLANEIQNTNEETQINEILEQKKENIANILGEKVNIVHIEKIKFKDNDDKNKQHISIFVKGINLNSDIMLDPSVYIDSNIIDFIDNFWNPIYNLNLNSLNKVRAKISQILKSVNDENIINSILLKETKAIAESLGGNFDQNNITNIKFENNPDIKKQKITIITKNIRINPTEKFDETNLVKENEISLVGNFWLPLINVDEELTNKLKTKISESLKFVSDENQINNLLNSKEEKNQIAKILDEDINDNHIVNIEFVNNQEPQKQTILINTKNLRIALLDQNTNQTNLIKNNKISLSGNFWLPIVNVNEQLKNNIKTEISKLLKSVNDESQINTLLDNQKEIIAKILNKNINQNNIIGIEFVNNADPQKQTILINTKNIKHISLDQKTNQPSIIGNNEISLSGNFWLPIISVNEQLKDNIKTEITKLLKSVNDESQINDLLNNQKEIIAKILNKNIDQNNIVEIKFTNNTDQQKQTILINTKNIKLISLDQETNQLNIIENNEISLSGNFWTKIIDTNEDSKN